MKKLLFLLLLLLPIFAIAQTDTFTVSKFEKYKTDTAYCTIQYTNGRTFDFYVVVKNIVAIPVGTKIVLSKPKLTEKWLYFVYRNRRHELVPIVKTRPGSR